MKGNCVYTILYSILSCQFEVGPLKITHLVGDISAIRCVLIVFSHYQVSYATIVFQQGNDFSNVSKIRTLIWQKSVGTQRIAELFPPKSFKVVYQIIRVLRDQAMAYIKVKGKGQLAINSLFGRTARWQNCH